MYINFLLENGQKLPILVSDIPNDSGIYQTLSSSTNEPLSQNFQISTIVYDSHGQFYNTVRLVACNGILIRNNHVIATQDSIIVDTLGTLVIDI